MQKLLKLELAVAVGLGLLVAAPAGAQEIGYSIAPSSKVVFGEHPYGRVTRTPNEIYNPSPLLPYSSPSEYMRYPTFDIDDVPPPEPVIRLRGLPAER